jgi:hypothetical protein
MVLAARWQQIARVSSDVRLVRARQCNSSEEQRETERRVRLALLRLHLICDRSD